jgi:hypothetical protein
MSDNSLAPSGRSTWLVLSRLALCGLIWWSLPTSSVADVATVAASPSADTLEPKAAAPLNNANIEIPTPAFSLEDDLGPSKGSLLSNPKPRDLLLDRALYVKLDSVERHMTARSVAEAEWMDTLSFPTLEEVNAIDPESLEKYHHKPNINLRALAIQAAIWKRRNDPRWREVAVLISSCGSIFGNRLLIDEELEQPFSLSRDKKVINLVLVGKMLGDSYKPYGALIYKLKGTWTTLSVMTNAEIAFDTFQVIIPRARARAGLPPLKILRIPLAGRQ